MVKKEENEKVENGVYEVGYLVAPKVSEDKVSVEVDKILEMIKKEGAVIITDEFPKLRELSYPMEKIVAHKKEIFLNAYFGWVKFELDRDMLDSLRNELGKEENIIRFLLISTVRENTIASRRPVTRPTGEIRRNEAKGVKMSDEEIEKTIEQLIRQ